MQDAINPKFVFESKAVDRNTFHVVRFKGTEGLSMIYRFEMTLISKQADLDGDSILQQPAVFTIKRPDGDIPFHGMLSSFEQMQQMGEMVFYRAELVPRFWWAMLTSNNQIFLHKNARQFIGESLASGGKQEGLHFDFKLEGGYPTREYVCQYNESHFNFASRWMEREGMYYYFEQTEQGEKMIITDTHLAHSVMAEGSNLIYSPPSGLDTPHREEVIKNFILRQQPVPQKVLLKDYNYQKPNLDMKAEAVVSEKGIGDVYMYGDHFLTQDEGQKLAKVRAEEFRCRSNVYYGVSTVPYVRTGYIFELKDHYRDSFNQRYLTTKVTHEGRQERYLVSGLNLHLNKNEDCLFYRNSFSCIPAATQYRPRRIAEKPKFHGSMNAKIDASGTGQYAELDNQGRYKVRLPMDISCRSGGKATTWLRMAQPYGGTGHGMHFPLHKGTEVLLTCIDGDPDRPIIQAAVPNPDTPSMVHEGNHTQCQITTGGQNKIHMEDLAGKQRILMQSPTSNTWVRMGSTNDPPPSDITLPDLDIPVPPDEEAGSSGISREAEGGKDGYKLYTDKHIEIFGGSQASTILGNTFSITGGGAESIQTGEEIEFKLSTKQSFFAGLDSDFKMGGFIEVAPLTTKLYEMESKFDGDKTKVTGNSNKVKGQNTSMSGSATKMSGSSTKMAGSASNMNGNKTTLNGQSSKLTGAANTVQGSKNTVQGSQNAVVGSNTSVAGQSSGVTGSQNAVSGSSVQVAGNKTSTSGATTTVTGSSTKLASQQSTIAGLVTII